MTIPSHSVLLLLALSACGAAGPTRIDLLNAAGVRAYAAHNAWYELRADEGYRFRMPAVPEVQEETFALGGQAIPERFFEVRTEGHSRAFMLRAFDTRELAHAQREEVRLAAIGTLQTDRTSIRERHPVPGGEELIVEGYGHMHDGLMQAIIRDGFVFVMVTVMQRHSGAPTDAATFFQSVRVDR